MGTAAFAADPPGAELSMMFRRMAKQRIALLYRAAGTPPSRKITFAFGPDFRMTSLPSLIKLIFSFAFEHHLPGNPAIEEQRQADGKDIRHRLRPHKAGDANRRL